ncbi:MAG: cyclomaltodextrinase N-terminal domain-containing protein, partial [Planctomycetota bacterium]
MFCKHSNRRCHLIFILLLIPHAAFSQSVIERVEPPFWWTGMHNQELQLMVYGKDIAELTPKIEYDGVSIRKTVLSESRNYLFIYLNIEQNAADGEFRIQLKNN